MKKFLLLIPVGLLAATGVFWVTSEQNFSSNKNIPSSERLPHGSQELFTDSEHSLRQIVRHGDENAIKKLNFSLDAIHNELSVRQKQGYDVKNIEILLSQYKRDSTILSNKFIPYLKQIQQYDQFEEKNEKPFLVSL